MGIIISISVALLLGVILIQIIANQTNDKTELKTFTETVNIAGAKLAGGVINQTYYFVPKYMKNSAGFRTDNSECSVSSIQLKNSSGFVLDNNGCALAGDYTFVADIRYNLCNVESLNGTTGGSPNTTTITYRYCAEDYVATGWARSLLDLVPGFFAIALLIIAAFSIMYILKENGVEF